MRESAVDLLGRHIGDSAEPMPAAVVLQMILELTVETNTCSIPQDEAVSVRKATVDLATSATSFTCGSGGSFQRI